MATMLGMRKGNRPGAPGMGWYGGLGPATGLRPGRLVLVHDQSGGGAVRPVAMDRLVHLLPVDRDVLWRDDAEPHLVTPDLHDRDDDVVVDYDALVFFPGQDEHGCVSFPGLEPIKERTRGHSTRNLGRPRGRFSHASLVTAFRTNAAPQEGATVKSRAKPVPFLHAKGYFCTRQAVATFFVHFRTD